MNSVYLKKMLVTQSCHSLFSTPWTVTHQAPLSMEFSRQEYWNRLPFGSPGDLPDSGMEPESPALKADSLPSEPPGKPNSYLVLCKVSIENCGHVKWALIIDPVKNIHAASTCLGSNSL